MASSSKEILRMRRNFGKIPHIMDIPNLIEVQKRSYERFLQREVAAEKREDIGLQAVFKSVFPIADIKKTSSLEFISYSFGELKYGIAECCERAMTFAAPLKVNVRLIICEKDKDLGSKSIKDIKEQEIYLGEIPLMTERGTFIINGTERTVVSQMHRSPGVFYSQEKIKDHTSVRPTFLCRIIPYRGSWVEFELGDDDLIQMRIDRRRKLLGTTLLRALGIVSDYEILRIFYQIESISIGKDGTVTTELNPEIHTGTRASMDIKHPKTSDVIVRSGNKIHKSTIKRLLEANVKTFRINTSDLLGRVVAEDVINTETGEILLETNSVIDELGLEKILENKIEKVSLLAIEGSKVGNIPRNTLAKDVIKTREEALIEIYKRMRPGDPPTVENSRFLFEEMFFNPKRYNLSQVGRLKLNKKLGIEADLDKQTLDKEDFIEILRYHMQLAMGYGEIDDIDHLGNRRVRSVGELMENQFRVGLVRMERAIRERMSIQDQDSLMPHDLINAKPVMAVVKEFFGSSQLSQFMDQTNPLAELTHKRRLSALGPGGLSRDRAGFEARDVHPTHYGRVCPIETPEGPNIGLITSLSTYARVNDFGFIETPYRKVEDCKVTAKIEYLTAIDESRYIIAQANAPLNDDGTFVNERISARKGEDFVMVHPEDVQYMDVSPKQLVSVSASLIPFLEHDDANRALMGSNMQRQAVPLLRTDAPLVGTGMEAVVTRNSGSVILAKHKGIVGSVTADRIIIKVDEKSRKPTDPIMDIIPLTKFQRSNQNTCNNQKPIVRAGYKVEKGDVIADGPATSQGELALGHNVLVAFMPWGGYNFEDAILISEKVAKDDRYTSIHIEEFQIQARDTKLGKEEVTRDIPNVGEETLRNLDESGIIHIGVEVKPGDVLVGKVTPKGETQLTPEEKLLRAIFGEKAGDVRDASLVVPPGIEGVVVDVKVFSRKGIEKDKRTQNIENADLTRLERDLKDEIRIIQKEEYGKIHDALLNQKTAEAFINLETREILIDKGKKITKEILNKIPPDTFFRFPIRLSGKPAQDQVDEAKLRAQDEISLLKSQFEEKISKLGTGMELPPGVIKLVKVYIAMKRKLSVGDKMAGRHGNKGVISKILPEEDMPYLPDGTPVEIVLNPLGVPSRMNVGQIMETHLGWAAKALGNYVSVPVFDGASEEEIKAALREANLPESGKTALYDGRTGEQIQQEVTVGYIYMLKLSHLVDDKIHARSIGPYSLVTQQPLGGKAQFGGQRFGEMEVWALEAYGAAYTLQEILTIKSDDVQGRTKAYEAIVKGEDITTSGIPESFNVLVKELQSLCLDVELLQLKNLA